MTKLLLYKKCPNVILTVTGCTTNPQEHDVEIKKKKKLTGMHATNKDDIYADQTLFFLIFFSLSQCYKINHLALLLKKNSFKCTNSTFSVTDGRTHRCSDGTDLINP